jgi:hypothetical protein
MTIDTRLEKAMGKVQELAGKRALQHDAEVQARRRAIAASIDAWLDGLDEPARRRFFAAIESHASARNRKVIQGHPLRPEGMPLDGKGGASA